MFKIYVFLLSGHASKQSTLLNITEDRGFQIWNKFW